MRILYVNPPASMKDAGGIQTYARELPAGMRQRGHEVLQLDAAPETVLAELAWSDRLPSPLLLNRYYFWRGFFLQDYRYHKAVRRRVQAAQRRFKPDVVHGLHVYLLGAFLDRDAPTAVSGYGLEIEDCPPVRTSLRNATGVHCISEFAKGMVEKVVDRPRNLGVHSWGVQGADDSPREQFDFDLITVGRLVPRKNILTVLRALEGRRDLRYAIVGDGPDETALRDFVREKGLDRVEFLGRRSDEERRSLLRRSKAFIMCPRKDLAGDVEGLGLVYFEAHAAGAPVVAARSGGAPEAVGDAGVLVDDPLDRDQVQRAIENVLDDRAAWEAKVRIRQQTHSWDAFLAGMERWYGQLQAAKPTR